jgi:hypothetical protein
MVRKKAVGRPPMKSVAKATVVTPNPNQLNLDFEGRAPAEQKARVKAPRVRKAPTGIDITPTPKG